MHVHAISATTNTTSNSGVYEDSVLPVIEAGQAQMVDPDGSEFLEGIAFHPAPGHTIGQMAISLTSPGANALFGGDVMHHPIQVYRPEWNSRFCEGVETQRQHLLFMDVLAGITETSVELEYSINMEKGVP
jgi:glyoxylase-like metal-dependent hydrolase (beta-lactamase superfamily II)